MKYTNEQEFKLALQGALAYIGWDTQAHEDKNYNFIPDLSFSGDGVDGWIEVKWCHENPTSVGSIPHWTVGQEMWLMKRGERGGGHCFLVVGTPDGVFCWRYNRLEHARTGPWKWTIRFCIYRGDNLLEFVQRVAAVYRRRGTA